MKWLYGMVSAILVVLSGLILLSGPALAEVVVYAPGGLAQAMEDIAAMSAKAGHPFKLIVGHSPAQARQIVDGAPGDLFISADPQWMDFLGEKGLLDKDSSKTLAFTRLVLVAPLDRPIDYHARPGESLAAQLGDGKLGIGDPDALPVGRFTRQALTKLGAWDDLRDRLAILPDVRTVIAMAERNEIAAGIAYSSSIDESSKVRVVTEFPADVAPPVTFPVAFLAGHRNAESESILSLIQGPEGAAILKAHGFSVP